MGGRKGKRNERSGFAINLNDHFASLHFYDSIVVLECILEESGEWALVCSREQETNHDEVLALSR